MRERNATPPSAPASAARVTVASYRSDPLYPTITRAVAAILESGNVVAPVDVLVRIGWLAKHDLEAWRFGRVSYLERVIQCNLTKLGRCLRILGFHCHDLNLTASQTAYVKWGKGRRTPLRFTKTNEATLERVYARHFVRPAKRERLPVSPATSADETDRHEGG